jgi:hypothetical protein
MVGVVGNEVLMEGAQSFRYDDGYDLGSYESRGMYLSLGGVFGWDEG